MARPRRRAPPSFLGEFTAPTTVFLARQTALELRSSDAASFFDPPYHDDVTLVKLDLTAEKSGVVPQTVKALLADAANRIEQFFELHKDNPTAGFVPSDYEMVYHSLRGLRNGAAGGTILPGNAFCEWGSGFGVIACLASIIGYDSVGIEIDPKLVTAAQALARDHRVAVELVQGSYVPDGHETAVEMSQTHVMTLEDGPAAYEDLGLDPEDFDCIFAYPWPGEDEVVTEIFDKYAARGAVLVTFHGRDGMLARRKK